MNNMNNENILLIEKWKFFGKKLKKKYHYYCIKYKILRSRKVCFKDNIILYT